MSLRDLQDDFNNIIKPQLEEILKLLNKNAQDVTGNIEVAAAKIITELKPLIQDCQHKEEILQALQQQEPTGKQIITNDNSLTKPLRYSYPNYNVGNDDLGTGKNPGSLTWPFNDPKKLE